ncbi:MAG TPA: cytochrome c biogenesis protein ResB [Candidatus Hydrogenedentes bacterium]|nr:cytochrome c biogenesis protein ResB [Candidatus Hydrogenedentota bacterium]
MRLFKGIFTLMASYGLSVLLLIALLLLVFMGTLEQTRIGLYEAQQKYFESLVVVPRLFGVIPVPVPGAYLLLSLLFINMLCGAIIKAPKSFSRPGLLIAHGGILLLVLYGVVSYHFSVTGNIPLYVGDSNSKIQSYYDWEMRITEVGENSGGRQFVIPLKELKECRDGHVCTFQHPDLPFGVAVGPFYENSTPETGTGALAVDGIVLREIPPASSAEQNVPGLFVELSGTPFTRGLLWGMEQAPWLAQHGEQHYAIALSRREWPLPFSLTLERFDHEKHPGTDLPSMFSSSVIVREGEALRNAVIRMNEPLRHRSYTFYQASWGPANAKEGDRLYSVLAVSKNPAMKWPVYASVFISFGLMLHYAQVLLRDLMRRGGKPENDCKTRMS